VKVNFGGTQLSCSDSKHSSLMIFLRGCDYKCFYCQNKELQSGKNLVDAEEIKDQINEHLPLISQIIFSGGEPLVQPEAIEAIARYAHFFGLKVGIETSGAYSSALLRLIEKGLIDEVFLDIKTFGEDEYYKLTGKLSAWLRIKECVCYCKAFNIPLEARTTIFKEDGSGENRPYPGKKQLEEIEQFVKERNLNWKKQEGILEKYEVGF